MDARANRLAVGQVCDLPEDGSLIRPTSIQRRPGRGWEVETMSVADNTTIHQACDNWAAQERDAARHENGRRAVNQRPVRLNFVGKYSFTEGRLKGVHLGGGFRYRSGSVLGYGVTVVDAVAGKYARNPEVTYRSKGEFFPDVFASYSFKVWRDVRCRMQINIRSLFEREELIPLSTLSDGRTAQYGYKTGQQITGSTTFTF